MELWLRETFVNQTTGHQFGESDWTKPYTEERGKLFKVLQREYGRCSSKMYIDINGQPNPKAIGWVFEGSQEYSDNRGDCHDSYIREVWVELFEGEPCDWNKGEAFECDEPGQLTLSDGRHSCSKHVAAFIRQAGTLCVTA